MSAASSRAAPAPHLSKSKVLAGLQCERRVWLACNEPSRAGEPDPATRARFDAGSEVGVLAHRLFPGGVVVGEPAWEHAAAVARTRALLARPEVPAIFEAAFEHAGVRIRVDVLERLADGRFGLREVKSTTSVKPVHLDDLAVQQLVLEGSGLAVASVELVHVDADYVRGADGIDWARFFARVDCAGAVAARLPVLRESLPRLHAVVGEPAEPEAEPDGHCSEPYDCPYWGWCTRDKPRDWVYHLPRLGAGRYAALRALGVERIAELPDDAELSALQARVRDAHRDHARFVSPDLGAVLAGTGPPASYLDFEALNPVVPLYPGTRPYELVPFQWSLHGVDAEGVARHRDFLAEGSEDPRRAFAETLLAALERSPGPVAVYSGFEASRLRELRGRLPDLAPRLDAAVARLVDLLPVVRAHVYDPAFRFSFSLKRVAPALAPGFGWADLGDVAEGAAAAAAFGRIASGQLAPPEAARLRRSLRRYCKRDTEALVVLHRGLRRLAGAA